MTEQYIRKPNTTCLMCSKPIYRRPSEITETKSRVFCSAVCYGLSCRKETPCVVCGKGILAGHHKKTCSRFCSNKHRASQNYIQNKPIDKVVTLRRIKVRLLKIRGEKCERCDYNKIKVLQVHHTNKNRADNRLSNLELICPNCHYEEHYL